MTSSRDAILMKIRAALAIPLSDRVHIDSLPEINGARRSLSQVTPSAVDGFDAMTDQFARWSERLRTEFTLFPDTGRMRSAVRTLVEENNVQSATHRGIVLDEVCAGLDIEMILGNRDDVSQRDLASCDIGITECDALIANTGSVLITAQACGGRALSILPPHHVVLANASQLVPDLPSGYALLREKYGAGTLPAFISLITGPSRTADIERILVLGAHGPKRLTVLLSRE